eukprot:GHVS01026838.1.p1 GENE.GHVS01026838.1~~GHVS01026838.1.p1  ORF type:complete len:391 (+),score=94.16 GHVS01026838.1:88-1173(+)
MEQLVYLSKGSSRNPMPNPLLEYAAANNVQVLSVQLPGRSARYREEGLKSAQEVAENLFKVLKPLLVPLDEVQNGKWDGGDIEGGESAIGILNSKQSSVPYILIGHSMGCFCLYEFVRLLQQKQQQQLIKPDTSENNQDNICSNSSSSSTTLTTTTSTSSSSCKLVPAVVVVRYPLMLLLTCCISPDYPTDKRPWNKSYGMTDNQLKEEAKLWDVNSEVFKDDIWSVYSKLFRTDFPIFDTYIMTPKHTTKTTATTTTTTTTTAVVEGQQMDVVSNNIVCWYAEFDKRIKREMVEGWGPLLDKLPEGVDAVNNRKGGCVGPPDGCFEVRPISGATHGFLYDSKLRETWMREVIGIISKQTI